MKQIFSIIGISLRLISFKSALLVTINVPKYRKTGTAKLPGVGAVMFGGGRKSAHLLATFHVIFGDGAEMYIEFNKNTNNSPRIEPR